jgi:lipopolysaccharide/colanic/teichoic acid biosynthesis glycosyltransferase
MAQVLEKIRRKEYLEDYAKCDGVYNKIFKPIIGFCIAIVLLILLSPIFIFLAIAIILETGLPVFYKAPRGGYNGKTFYIYKFRSMVQNADKIGGGTTALKDSRITKVGSFLRKTKLDEIPQLFNILKFEMSFVGPRPELLQYTDNYDEKEKNILRVRPGITDYSSIEFINLDEIVGNENADEMYEKYVLKQKNELRIKYAQSVSFFVDLKLFFKTVLRTIEKALKVIFIIGGNNGKYNAKKL